MNGTKLPDSVKTLSQEKDIILFVDGDRGGKLIIQNVLDNAKVKYIAFAPDGKEVEELSGKEVLMNLRKKVSVEEFLEKSKSRRGYSRNDGSNSSEEVKSEKVERLEVTKDVEEKLKEIYSKNKSSGKAVLLDSSLKEIKAVSSRGLGRALENAKGKVSAIVIDGTVTGNSLKAAEDSNVSVVVAKNFTTTSSSLKLLSF
jgi:DNA primase